MTELLKTTEAKTRKTRKLARLQRLNVDEIVYAKSVINYTELKMVSGDAYLVSKTLKEVEDYLPPHKFFRVHKSYMVGVSFLDGLQVHEEPCVKLTTGECIPLSRRRKEEFLSFLRIIRPQLT
ncbi:MAG: LytR/AlgR family response regulator transcription factor [Spirosomataceae bacterium]